MFKVGDIVEGVEDDRWIMGKVVCVHHNDGALGIDVFKTELLGNDSTQLHNLNGCISTNNGWWLMPTNAKSHKNHFVKHLIKDL